MPLAYCDCCSTARRPNHLPLRRPPLRRLPPHRPPLHRPPPHGPPPHRSSLVTSTHKYYLMLLLCCNLLSLAEGGSTTVVAGGFHLLHCCRCRSCESRACRRQLDRSNWIEGTPRRSESETIAEVHANGASFIPVFWDSLVYPQAGSTHISRCKHRCAAPPCVLRFWCFFFSLFHRARRRLCGLLAPY